MISEVPSLIFLWLLVAFAFGLVVLSAHALHTERREGLPASLERVGLLALVALALLIMASRETFDSLAPVSLAPEGPALVRPAAPAVDRVDELRKHIASSCPPREQERFEQELGSLAAPQPAPSPSETATAPTAPVISPKPSGPGTGTLRLSIAVLLVAFAGVALLVLGRRETLPFIARLFGRPTPASEEPLQQAIAAALRGDDATALRLLDPLHEGGLPLLGQLDFLFVRATAALLCRDETAGDRDARRARLAQAERDARRLVELAPNMPEARYLLGTILGVVPKHAEALECFRAAGERLAAGRSKDLPGLELANNESVCLLALAKAALETGDLESAQKRFAEVSRLGVHAGEVSLTIFTHKLTMLRKAIRESRFDEARTTLDEARATPGLAADARERANTVCDVYDLTLRARSADRVAAAEALRQFLKKRLPADIPDPDEQVADEALFPFESKEPLTIPAAAFRTLFFWLAVSEARIRAEARRPLNESSAAPVILALLRALQFEARQRDALAGLGAIYYWFIPAKRERGLGWIRSAATLGVRSRVVARLLERERLFQAERRVALDHFLDATSRFLLDPTLSARVRAELVNELGRFESFRPLLMDLGTLPEESQAVTLEAVRQRARYVNDLVERCGSGSERLRRATLSPVSAAYKVTVTALEGTLTRLGELEKQVIVEVGRSLLS